MSKLKYNTRKIINFHVVHEILRNKILTHTNFSFFKYFFEMKKVKSNKFKTNKLSYIDKNIKIKV